MLLLNSFICVYTKLTSLVLPDFIMVDNGTPLISVNTDNLIQFLFLKYLFLPIF